jgi:P4 family phage/plasmid primase-like protien
VTDKSFMEARGLPATPKVEHQGPKWAAALVRKGAHVHPLKLGSKLPATENGVLDAVADSAEITGNYGVSMGASGLVAVDLDDYIEGNDIEAFAEKYELPQTFTVLTGSGGRSLWYAAPAGVELRNKQDFGGHKGIDIRANGGYALGPGNKLHPSNIKPGAPGDGVYAYDPEGGVEFAPLPQRLVDDMLEAQKPKELTADQLGRNAGAAAYEAADEVTKRKIDQWLDKVVGGIMGELDAMKRWPEGYREEFRGEQEGWEAGVLRRTYRLAQIVNADWNPLGKDDVIGLLRQNLPNDSSFTLADGLGKFIRALGNADPAHYPIEDEVDLFDGVEDRSSSPKADGGTADEEEVTSEAKLVGGVQGHIVFDTKGCRRIQVDEDGKQKEKELLPATTAQRITKSWPIGKQPLSTGQNWWIYKEGAWILNDSIVRLSMAASFLDNYKRADVVQVEDVMSTMVDEIRVEPHPSYINFRNGMLNWRTGELADHDPSFKSTVQLPHDWNSEATCPKFDEWLDQRLSGEGIQLAWELIATTLYSGNPIQRAGLLYGVGKSGKSTFLETVQGLVGDANCAALSPQDMTKTVFATHSLLGKQANIVTDIDPTKIAETAIFKRVVASEAIQAQQKNKPEFSFRPFCNHLFSANQIPRSSDRTSAWTRRFAILRFMEALGVETKIVDQYHRVLLQEAEGIIAKAVSFLPDLLARGDYSIIEADQDEFEKATDFTSEFWEEAATVTGSMQDFTATEHIAKAFEIWCQRNGYSSRPPVDDIVLKLRDNVKVKKDRGRVGGRQVRGWKGIVLSPEYRIDVTEDQKWDIAL